MSVLVMVVVAAIATFPYDCVRLFPQVSKHAHSPEPANQSSAGDKNAPLFKHRPNSISERFSVFRFRFSAVFEILSVLVGRQGA